MSAIPSISVDELRRRKEAREPLVLVDVREPNETAYASIADSIAIPLRTLPASLGRIPADRPVVVYCHHGGRSAQAVAYLIAQGRDNVANLNGGIDSWSMQIDPEVPRY
jgi:rhodanese-related sulfurtransferase